MQTDSRVNVLLITIDCLRPDHMGVYGYERSTTPSLDHLAREGVRFTQAISQGPCTRVSFSAMLSATYPGMFGGFLRLSPARRVFAEFLRDAGYHTVAFGSNPYLSPVYGYDKGFEIFDSSLVPWIEPRRHWLLRYLNRFFFIARRLLPYLPADKLTAKAMRFLNHAPRAAPWFLWLHYMDVHDPYRPPRRHARRFQRAQLPGLSDRALWKKALHCPRNVSEIERRHLIDLYDAEINFVDAQIGRLLTYLRRLNLHNATLVIITADHGEEFGEHGEFSHRFKLYDELLRVPLLLRFPPRLPAGQVITSQVRLLDLVPTVLDLIELESRPMEGKSLLPLIEGRDAPPRIAISETHPETGLYSIREAGWKLILNVHTGKVELYNLQHDPHETTDQAGAAPLIRHQLETKLRLHVNRIASVPTGAPSTAIDNLTLDRLRALGYEE